MAEAAGRGVEAMLLRPLVILLPPLVLPMGVEEPVAAG